MISDMSSGIDLSALSWVQGEIDQSLTHGLESLAVFKQTPSDHSALQRARTHFRHAVGAIQMIGLDALAVYSGEIELQLDRLGTLPADQIVILISSIERATGRLQTFIAEILRGAPLSPLVLFSEYDAMQQQRGVKESNPADLFFPDLSPRIADDGPQVAVDPKVFPIFLIRKRRVYQLGLLDWLRGNHNGIEQMREAAEDIQAVTPQRINRTFWWLVSALFDVVHADAVPNTFSLKQLLARIDLQIRRLTEGSNSIAERLWREALYLIALGGAPATERVQSVQNLFKLSTMMPSATHGDNALAVYRIIREVQKRIETLKTIWARIIAGQTDLIPVFKEELVFVQKEAAVSPYGEMNRLFTALNQGLESLAGKSAIAESTAMEYATILLFAEDVFAQYGNPIPGLPKQVEMLYKRVQMALAGQALPLLNMPRLEEVTRKAEDKALLPQLVSDIQANLRHMEQELDVFFRDRQKRDGLSEIAKDGQEISGALRLLGYEKADQLLQACMAQIDSYTKPDAELVHEDFELLAESLSALGFYVESLEQQKEPRESLILPLLARYHERNGTMPPPDEPPPTGGGGISPENAPVSDSAQPGGTATTQFRSQSAGGQQGMSAVSTQAEMIPIEAVPVEVSVGDTINTLRHLGQQLRMNPHDKSLLEMIGDNTRILAADANLMSDAALAEKIKTVKELLRPGDEERLAESLDKFISASQTEQPSEEGKRLLSIDAGDLDNELLEIYLAEAMEVLDSVRDNRKLLAGSPGDIELLRNVRRAFHTLKGSGRMVGLTDLGELAFDVEKIHNKLLEIGCPATPVVLNMMETAENEFRCWVQSLISEKKVSPAPEILHAAIAAVEKELAGGGSPTSHPSAKHEKHAQSPAVVDASPVVAAVKQTPLPEAKISEKKAAVIADSVRQTDTVQKEAMPPFPVIETIQTIAPIQSSPAPVAAAELVAPKSAVAAQALHREPPALSDDDAQEISMEVVAKAPITPPHIGGDMLSHISIAHTDIEKTKDVSPSRVRMEAPPVTAGAQKSYGVPSRSEISDSGGKTAERPVIEKSLSADDSDFRLEIPLRKKEKAHAPVSHAVLETEGHIVFEVPLAGSYEEEARENKDFVSGIVLETSSRSDGNEVRVRQDGDTIHLEMGALSTKPAPHHRRSAVVELRMFGDEPDSSPESAEIEEMTAKSSTAPAGQDVALATEENIRIGSVVLTRTLFDLFLEEAEQHWGMLNRQMTLMQMDSAHTPDDEMVRAAHTLASILSTTGFFQVAEIAKSLELFLLTVKEHARSGARPSSKMIPVVARAVAGLRALLDRIAVKEAFAMAEEREAEAIVKEIKQLQRQEYCIPEGGQPDAEENILHEAKKAFQEDSAGAIPTVESSMTPLIEKPKIKTAPIAQPDQKEPIIPPAVGSTEKAGGESGSPSDFDFRSIFSQHSPQAAVNVPEAVEEYEALRSIHDEVDAQLLPLFLDESRELFSNAQDVLWKWCQDSQNQDLQLKLKRSLHTLKGGARMVGAMRLGELAHQMETRLEENKPDEGLFLALEEDFEHIGYVLERLAAGETDIKLPWLEAEEEAEEPPEIVEDRPRPDKDGDVSTAGVFQSQETERAARTLAAAQKAAKTLKTVTSENALLRVSSSRIDQLVNETGEIIIARTRAEGELRELKTDLLELTGSVIRLRQNVRAIEIEAESQIQAQLEQMQEIYGDFDPLEFDRYTKLQEMTRSLAEGVNDVATIQQAMLGHLDTVNQALFSQSKISRDVQQSLFGIRTVPFSSVTERLYRIQRSLTKELQKRANLEIRGGQHELDRAVLERLIVPLEHLLRNSLDHGIEAPEIRQKAGKPGHGEIAIEVRQAGSEIVVVLSDDGAGLSLEKVREKAQAKGIDSGKLDEAQLLNLIFEPGFSTAKTVTAVSGRGIGLDIVQSEITALGGRIEVSSEPGRGTKFTIYLPLTVAVAQTVLLRGAQNRIWAVPAAMVEQVEHVSEKTLAAMYRSGETIYRSEKYPFFYFDRLVDRADTLPEMTRYNPVIFLRTGQGRVAVHVDQILGNQEVVVKSAGTQQVRRIQGLSGATILGTGEIVLIVNPVQLSHRERTPVKMTQPVASVQKKEEELGSAPRVLIVDDSLTIRKVTSRLMQREGYIAEMAKDGFDALKMLTEKRPDIILLDIEMPRMDGFEFAKLAKSDPDFKDIPIIMITSRTADKHRERAMALGVGAYLGKPYQEDELLDQISTLLGEKAKFAKISRD